ncbi:hypothetical protein QYE76_063822 [Lolium multiflorum]|uniref:Transposase MuDR plant domain-containing protein n=1 Tax=Lolium multiflorum TaxID=4521 RepID=A0AAD8S863_LOLMU|nr:hypothetical protein QYE76_063822 [Lolium multiflorum]
MSQEEATQSPIVQSPIVQSPIVQSPIVQQPPLDNEYDEHDNGDDGFEMNGNNVDDLDKYWTQEEMDHSIPYSRCYVSDSDDDGTEEEVDEDGLTAKEAERAEIFKKIWLKEFSIKHHRPYLVVHSDLKKRYTLKCVDKRCPWVVRARPFKKGPSWHITSCVATHMCRGPKLDGKDAQPDHRQLTSEFIAYKLSAEISSLPIMSIKSVQDTVKSRFAYDVKYGKAWKAKQAAFKMLYAVTRCSGGDGGDDDGDDGDDDGDDVQLEDGDDGVDFPLREGISPADFSLPESSFLSGVFLTRL